MKVLTMRRALLVSMLAAVVFAGCDTLPGEPVPVLEARTTADSYAVGAPITVRIRNPTRSTMHFAHCDDRLSFTVLSRRGEVWDVAGSVDGDECSGVRGTRALEPGETYERTFTLMQPGTYRLRFLTGRLATSVGNEILYSNTFAVGPS
jgi:hypothetical protein